MNEIIEINEKTKLSEIINNNWDKKKLRSFLLIDELKKRLALIESPKNYTLCHFLFKTGVRISEAIKIRKKDIDFNNSLITIKHLKSKTSEERVIPIHRSIRENLKLYVATMKNEDLIFDFTRQRAWKIVNNELQINPHSLRHSFAFHFLSQGGDITILQKILGHRFLTTTMVYRQIVPQDQIDAMEKITW